MMTWITRLCLAIATLVVLARAAAAHEPPPPVQPGYAPAYAPAQPPAPGQGYGYSVVETCCSRAPQPVPPPPPPATCFDPCGGYGYGGGYSQTGGYGQPQGRPQIFVEDMYGQWHEASGEEYERAYAYAQQQAPQLGSSPRYEAVRGPCCGYQPPAPPPYHPPPYTPPPSCGGCCASYPPPGYAPAPSCPPSYPPGYGEVRLNDSFFWGGGGVGPEVVYSGGGGGGGYAYAGAGASAYAGASASARVSVGGGGRYRPPPHRPPPGRPGKGGGCCH